MLEVMLQRHDEALPETRTRSDERPTGPTSFIRVQARRGVDVLRWQGSDARHDWVFLATGGAQFTHDGRLSQVSGWNEADLSYLRAGVDQWRRDGEPLTVVYAVAKVYHAG